MKKRKNKKKKAFMYMRIGLWTSRAECDQKIGEMQQFLESNGYEYDIHRGNVAVDMNDEQFNDIVSWHVIESLSEMKPIAKGAESFVVRTLTDLSKDKDVVKEMVHVIKGLGLDFKTTDGSEKQLLELEDPVLPEFEQGPQLT